MFLTLLIVTHVTAEWVEISQQHYRKPVRTSSYNPFSIPERFEVEETTKSWNYKNRTMSEYNVSKTPSRQTNTGNVNRIYFPADGKHADVVTTEDEIEHLDFSKDGVKQNEEGEYVYLEKYKFNRNEEERDEYVSKGEFQRNNGPPKLKTEFSDISQTKGTIQRVPNIGSVKRVQLNSTPVKSPAVHKNAQENEDMGAKTRYEERPLDDDRRETESFKDNRQSGMNANNRRIYLNQDRTLNNEHTSTFPTDEDDSMSTESNVAKKHQKPESKIRTTDPNGYSLKPAFVTEEKDLNNFKKQENSRRLGTTEMKNVFGSESTDRITKTIEETTKITQAKTNFNDEVKYRPENKDSNTEFNFNRDDTTNDQRIRLMVKNHNAKPEQHSEDKTEINKVVNVQDKIKNDKITENVMDNKINNMENMLKFLKVVADTISQNTRRSFGGKMRYLQELKNSILANIADRIDATWPDDDAPGAHRSSRSAHVSARGHHVHFPSSESALMTISFLTFAVFLIKLVLQVIHTYKNKTMMVAPVMVAASGRSPHHGRH